QAYNPAVAMVKGEYWGLLNFRERFDKHYFKSHFDLNEDQIYLLEYSADIVQLGDNLDYVELLSYLENNSLENEENYQYIQSRIDIDNFADHNIAHIFAGNNDWPHNNTVFWRKRTAFAPNAPYGQDGRWR